MTEQEQRASIRRLLKRWGSAAQVCRNRQDEIAEYVSLIDSAADLSPSKLTGMPHGGGISDPTALTAERVMKLCAGYHQRIADVTADIAELMDFVAVVDDILTEFPAEERQVIELRYRRFGRVNGDPWVRTARLMGYSIDRAKAIERGAIDRMSEYIDVRVF